VTLDPRLRYDLRWTRLTLDLRLRYDLRWTRLTLDLRLRYEDSILPKVYDIYLANSR
jgi:hypothetical protein